MEVRVARGSHGSSVLYNIIHVLVRTLANCLQDSQQTIWLVQTKLGT